MTFEEELVFIKDTALLAGKKILEIYQKGFNVKYKEDASPITEADSEANNIIIKRLAKKFPNYAILSEESKEDKSRKHNDWCFIVDPLDGTKEFISQNGEFTVNIALAYKQKAIIGVIYCPTTQELYYASKDKGAYYINLNEDPTESSPNRLQVSRKIEHLTLVGSKSHQSDKLKQLIKEKKESIDSVKSVGSSLKGCMVAKGEADVYYRFGYTCEWDTAAMQCIVEEAGGIVKQMDHSILKYNREDTLNRKGFYIVNRKENIFV